MVEIRRYFSVHTAPDCDLAHVPDSILGGLLREANRDRLARKDRKFTVVDLKTVPKDEYGTPGYTELAVAISRK